MENPPSSEPFVENGESENKTPAPPRPIRDYDRLWNALTVVFLAGMVVIVAYFLMIFNNPNASYNPFPPPTMVPTLFIPSITPLPTNAPTIPVPTSTFSVAPLVTSTPDQPTPTAIQATPIGTLSSGTIAAATPTAKVNSVYSFAVQGDPKAIDATLFDPNHGCTWMGVAGRAYDLQNGPATKLEVQLFGILNGNLLNLTSLTGTSTQYGPSGFEFTLANKPVASTQRLSIRLVDQAGIPLSDRVFFDTYSDCTKNLVVINFKQVK